MELCFCPAAVVVISMILGAVCPAPCLGWPRFMEAMRVILVEQHKTCYLSACCFCALYYVGYVCADVLDSVCYCLSVFCFGRALTKQLDWVSFLSIITSKSCVGRFVTSLSTYFEYFPENLNDFLFGILGF